MLSPLPTTPGPGRASWFMADGAAEGLQFPLHVALHKKACYVALQHGVTGPRSPTTDGGVS